MLQTAGISTTMITVIGIIGIIIKNICGHRVRSECCGREATAGVTVEAMEPTRTPRGSGASVVEVKAAVST